MDPVLLRTTNGRLDREAEAAFAALARRLKEGDAPLLIHLHGGLVDDRSGAEMARRLGGTGEEAYNAPEKWEQVYFIWHTGIWETIAANWRELHDNDRLYRALLEKLLGFIGGKVLSPSGRSVAAEAGLRPAEIRARLASGEDAPFADLDELAGAGREGRAAAVSDISELDFEQQLSALLHADLQFTEAAADIAAATAPVAGRAADAGDAASGVGMLQRLDGEVQTELVAAAAAAPEGADGRGLVSLSVLKSLVRHALRIGWRVLQRIRTGRDHGTHATIVEEILRELYGDLIGSTVWGFMKQDGADHFAAGGAGSLLLDALAAGPERRMLVVGHSAGAIWVSRMLEAMAGRGSRRKLDLVLLAPAVRCTLFAATLARAGGLIDRFRMFGMSDARERRDPVLGRGTGALYPSSLLYVVSGLFEVDGSAAAVDAPLLGLERFRKWQGGSLGRDEDAAAAAVKAFLAAKGDAEVYAPEDNGPGRRSDSRSHGGMDNDRGTLESAATFFAS